MTDTIVTTVAVILVFCVGLAFEGVVYYAVSRAISFSAQCVYDFVMYVTSPKRTSIRRIVN